MNEKAEALFDELFGYLQLITKLTTETRTVTSAEVNTIPEVARVLTELIILQSRLKGELR